MATYTNFFETMDEARIRLLGTIIVYDGSPYSVVEITDHRNDGVFRLYLAPIELSEMPGAEPLPNVGALLEPVHFDKSKTGDVLDNWMEKHPKCPLIRKKMNSPLFNKFRPFPLGMMNSGRGEVFFVERQPTRKTEQGLTPYSTDESRISLSPEDAFRVKRASGGGLVRQYSKAFADCIRGEYPTALECLTNLMDTEVINDAAAFHRQFAFVRGPIGMLFLAYKTDIVGVVPFANFETVKLGRKFKHVKEVVEGLNLFNSITYQN